MDGVGMRGCQWKGVPTNEVCEARELARLFAYTTPSGWVSLYVIISAAWSGLWVQG
ncbi:hypothetical protein D3C77_408850 [compost metagenome]